MCVPGAGGRDGDDHVVAREQRARSPRSCCGRPGRGPFPVVVALHGCGGLLNSRGHAAQPRDGLGRSLARSRLRRAVPRQLHGARHARDLHQRRAITSFPRIAPTMRWRPASGWPGSPSSTGARLALIGWSHGAMAVLWALRPGFMGDPPLFKTAIAFYPGCRQIDRLEDWRPSVPLTLMIGVRRRLDPAGPLPRASPSAPASASSSTTTPTTASTRPTRAVRVREGLGRPQGRQGARRHRSGGPRRLDQGGDGNPARGVPDAMTCATCLVAARAPDRLQPSRCATSRAQGRSR